MSTDPFFEHLFDYSKQVTPYLSGSIAPMPEEFSNEYFLHIDYPCSQNIQQIYKSIERAHPEAGSAYWLTRTWDLLCWQPVYVSFISIYALHGLPNVAHMRQEIQSQFVAGYSFDSTDHIHASEAELIEKAGNQLQQLFAFFREEMSQWTRIRPGFTNHLFADGILGCLVKLSKFAPQMPNAYLIEQASLWLSACNLSEKHLKGLSVNEENGDLTLVRTSCCLVYKCDGRELCLDCPRHPENKR